MGKKIASLLISVFIVLGVLFANTTIVQAQNTTYYVDSVNGNDSNNGTSTSTAWSTLSKVNSKTFEPGDKILFKSGCTWNGTLNLSGDGTPTSRITVGSYETGALPKISASTDNAINLIGESYWTIQNIEVSSSQLNGIFVDYQDSLVTDITISGVTVSNTLLGSSFGAGIKFGNHIGGHSSTPAKNGHFENILIENCYVHDCCGGIFVGGNIAEDGVHPRNANVNIKGNYVNKIISNGILVLATNGGTIENNRYADGRGGNQFPLCGIWSADCRNLTFQFNEVSGTTDTGDGDAYDLDWGNEYVTYQYNYSHNNGGGLILSCAYGSSESGGQTDEKYYNRYNVVRYNLGQNDSQGFSELYSSGVCHDNKFYNNTIVGSSSAPYMIHTTALYGSNTYGNYFKNNIIVNPSSSTILLKTTGTEYVLNNNDWYYPSGFNKIQWNGGDYTSFGTWKSASGQEANGIQQDPKLISLTSGGIDSLKLQQGSPCIDTGTDAGNMGSRDYWGNSIPMNGKYDIGAYEYTTATPGVSDTTVNDNTLGTGNNQFNYVGTWSYGPQSGAYQNDNHWSNTTNVFFQVAFNGVKIQYYGAKDPAHGIAAVSIDGGAEQDVDCYASTRQEDALLYTSSVLSNGSHTLKVRVKGTKNAGSSGYYVPADKVIISTPDTTVNDNTLGTGNNQFNYIGTWSYGPQSGAYQNDNHWSNTTNVFFQVAFNGVKIQYYGAKDPAHGIAAVSIDGGAEQDVDCYASTRQEDALLYTSSVLSNGSHTLKVRVKGTKNASSSGYYVPADKVIISTLTPGDYIDRATGGTATAHYSEVNQTPDKAFDDTTLTKWYDPIGAGASWIQYQFGGNNAYVITRYTITSAEDVPGRDPKNWTLEGSNNGSSWTDLDSRSGITFSSRLSKQTFDFSNSTAYKYYRLVITANYGGSSYGVQLSEMELMGQ